MEDFREDSSWVKLARTHWLTGGASANGRKGKKQQDVVKKEIWDPLEAEGFTPRSLLTLENLSVLEKYAFFNARRGKKKKLMRFDRFLWPTYTEDASNYHVLLIALIVSVKQGEHLSIWGGFAMLICKRYTLVARREAN